MTFDRKRRLDIGRNESTSSATSVGLFGRDRTTAAFSSVGKHVHEKLNWADEVHSHVVRNAETVHGNCAATDVVLYVVQNKICDNLPRAVKQNLYEGLTDKVRGTQPSVYIFLPQLMTNYWLLRKAYYRRMQSNLYKGYSGSNRRSSRKH